MANIILEWLFGGSKSSKRIPSSKGKKKIFHRRNKKTRLEQINSVQASRSSVNSDCIGIDAGQGNALSVILNWFFISKERRVITHKMVVESTAYIMASLLNEITDKDERSQALQNALLTVAAASDAIESKRSMAAILAEASGKTEH